LANPRFAKLREIFRELDANTDGVIGLEQLQVTLNGAKKRKMSHRALSRRLSTLPGCSQRSIINTRRSSSRLDLVLSLIYPDLLLICGAGCPAAGRIRQFL